MIRSFRSGSKGKASVRHDVAALETRLRWVAARLDEIYGSPHLGNLADPTAEFAFIVLSRKTAERAYVPAFRSLRRLGTWDQVLAAGEPGVERAIHGCGLETKKAHAIVAGLQAIVDRFGVASLSHAQDLSDDELFAFLAGLPEVGPKSARCVMLYSFARTVFPVDAHVGRVLARLGCMRTIGLELAPMGHKQRQQVLEQTIPPDLRFGLHVNLVAHGRAVCKAVAPACRSCVLATSCEAVRAGSGAWSPAGQ